MLTLARAKNSRGATGDPLPTVFQGLEDEGIRIRRGQLTLIAAAPGVGKSTLSMTIALKAGCPAFYFSADTDEFVVATRAAAMLSNYTTEEIEAQYRSGHTQSIDAALRNVNHVRWDFNPSIEAGPSGRLEQQLEAYADTYGDWPHLVVVDGLSQLEVGESSDTTQRLEYACQYLNEVARDTNAAVVALHHLVGPFDSGLEAAGQGDLKGKISKIPSLVLTLYRDIESGRDGLGRMFVCPVKNRTGPQDPSGGWAIPLHYEPPRMQLRDVSRLEY